MRRPLLTLLATLLAPLAEASAQALRWDVPPRGALVYRRTTELESMSAPQLRRSWLVAGAADGGHEWRYRACGPDGAPTGFQAPAFDDGDWQLGRGEFGPDAGAAGPQRTRWTSAELCLRTRFDLGRKKPRALVLRASHDDGIRVYANGTLVLQDDGVARERDYVLTGKDLDAFATGDNVLAVHCINTGGAQYVDVAIATLPSLPPGVRTAEELQAALQAERAAGDQVRGELFGAFRPPPFLTQGELDDDQQRIERPPADLRELAFWVATDLRQGVTGGSFQAEAPRLYRLGDLVLRGRVGAVDADGWQQFEVRVQNLPELLPRDQSKRFVSMFLAGHVVYGFDGTIAGRRRLQLGDGTARVLELELRCSGRVLRGKDWKETAAEFEQRERVQFDRAHENQDAAFRALVVAALQKGTARLKQALTDRNSPPVRRERPNVDRTYQSGRLALGLLALLKGGVPRDDPVVATGFADLRERVLVDTYTLGNALMALEALYAPPNEFADLKQGVIDRPRRRALPPAELQLAQRWTNQLLDNVDTRVDTAYLLRFNYVRGPRFDHSVNQYGLLGLYSAHLCGVTLPATVWEAAANHLISAQVQGGARMDLDLVDYRTLARLQHDPDARRTVTRLSVKPAGWNYEDPRFDGEDAPVWGSMTCACITGLAICQAALLDNPDVKRPKLQNDANAARNAGFGWLARNLSFRCHPGALFRQHQWFYYYLYGLERAALLSGVALLQDRDWYFEGALMLVLTQQPDGGWPPELYADDVIERDAMAILYLKQSTLPVLTGH